MNLLLIKMSSLGDVIHALPLAHCLKRGLDCKLHWVVNEAYAPLIKLCPDVDEVVPFPRDNIVRGMPAFLMRLRRSTYEMAVDVQGLLKSALVTYASGARKRVGLRDAREGATFFYNQLAGGRNSHRHAVDRYMEVARFLGLEDQGPVFNLGLPPRPEPLSRKKKVVVISPFARWPTKVWPLERYATLSDLIIKSGLAEVVFVGGPGDREKMDALETAMEERPVNLVGSVSLVELARVLADADMLISNDSGPMHLAVAMGVAVVALFGPTDPARTGPYGKGSIVLQHPVPCGPCLSRKCVKDLECLKGIDVKEVWGVARDLLEAG